MHMRDSLDIAELSFVMAAEALAAERIQEENRTGNEQCAQATSYSASAIKAAIDQDRQNRQKRLIG
jgi:hypothetical protein